MKCGVYDSELTSKGTRRKQVHIGSCGSKNKGVEARLQALADYNAQKSPINKIERIKPFDRPYSNIDHLSAGARECNLEHQEYGDLAVQYMRYIL